jgi:3-oxoacyl-(acyl-carrier-protein) synthase
MLHCFLVSTDKVDHLISLPSLLTPLQALIMAAMQEAGTTVLGFVASHGTGTPLGDPIESGAMRKAVVAERSVQISSGASFTVGAMKALVGHLEGTAGLAGLLLSHVQMSQQFAHGLRYR